jgi:cobalt/nickel transport system permease protein
MHIPDGFLSPPVALATGVAGVAGVGWSLRREGAHGPRAERVPAGVLGALAAFVFAAQMVNVPVTAGTSGHLVGATLVAMIVGPWRAVVVMCAVLVIQALLFQDGGFTALGANLVDMGIAGAFVGFTVGALVRRCFSGLRGVVMGAAFGAFCATLSGAALTALWLAGSGLYPLSGVLPLLLVTHAAIGVLEAALTGAIVATLARWRPDLLTASAASPSRADTTVFVAGAMALALAVAAFVTPFASPLPDGLQHAARALGFAGRARPLLPAPFAGAALGRGPFARFVPLIAGCLGTLLAAIVAWLAARGLPGRGRDAHR